jgi:hypothetical protein
VKILYPDKNYEFFLSTDEKRENKCICLKSKIPWFSLNLTTHLSRSLFYKLNSIKVFNSGRKSDTEKYKKEINLVNLEWERI